MRIFQLTEHLKGNLTVTGNLVVTGDTTIIDSQNMSVTDLLVLTKDTVGDTARGYRY